MIFARPPLLYLVDDSDDDAFFFKRTLRLAGFEGRLETFTDGIGVVDRLRQVFAGGPGAPARPDLVFLDLKMPLFNGFEVLEWLRHDRHHPALEVCILSGSETVTDVQRAMELGASSYFVKPIRLPQMVARLREWAERQQAPAVPPPGVLVGREDAP